VDKVVGGWRLKNSDLVASTSVSDLDAEISDEVLYLPSMVCASHQGWDCTVSQVAKCHQLSTYALRLY